MSTDDPRIPPAPTDAFSPSAWRKGFAACLAIMDAGGFDRPVTAEVRAAAEYGFKVENLDCGLGPVSGQWVIVGFEGEQYGPVLDSRREAEIEAVRRHKEDIRYA